MRNKVCGCGCHHFVPVLVILFALVFLLEALGYVGNLVVSVIWPILVGLGGIALLGEDKCGCC